MVQTLKQSIVNTLIEKQLLDKDQLKKALQVQKDQGGTDNWGEVKKIIASDAAASDFFGKSVSVSGDMTTPYGEDTSVNVLLFDLDTGLAVNISDVNTFTFSFTGGYLDDAFGLFTAKSSIT